MICLWPQRDLQKRQLSLWAGYTQYVGWVHCIESWSHDLLFVLFRSSDGSTTLCHYWWFVSFSKLSINIIPWASQNGKALNLPAEYWSFGRFSSVQLNADSDVKWWIKVLSIIPKMAKQLSESLTDTFLFVINKCSGHTTSWYH